MNHYSFCNQCPTGDVVKAGGGDTEKTIKLMMEKFRHTRLGAETTIDMCKAGGCVADREQGVAPLPAGVAMITDADLKRMDCNLAGHIENKAAQKRFGEALKDFFFGGKS